MNYDDRLTKLAVAYNSCNYAEVNSVALAMVDDFKRVNGSQQQLIAQLQEDNEALRMTTEHAAYELSKRLERIETLELQLKGTAL